MEASNHFNMDDLSVKTQPENANVWPQDDGKQKKLLETYGDGEAGKIEATYALEGIQRINAALQLREQNSIVFNGIAYSKAYVYNMQKAVNYAPPRNPKDDREVSYGLVHEKIIAFAAIFLKYRFRRQVKCYDKDGKLVPGLGDVYSLSIEFSKRMEQFVKKIALIYWELFTQGNAFVLEEFEVKTHQNPEGYIIKEDGTEGAKVSADNMDYTYEFLENLKYKPGREYQIRRAKSTLLDGRMVIFANPEIEEVQDQPQITIEDVIDRSEAETLYGTLSRWAAIPKDKTQIDAIVPEKITLFDTSRIKDPSKQVIRHRVLDKANNRMNLYLNGIMMLPRETPFTIFYPRNNYPLTNIPAERLSGSIYARSIPAKTKFNADYIDWILKNLALKFEQGVIPAILAKGKYTLSRQIFRAGQVTHGVSKDNYEKADPDNTGVTPAEMNFAQMIKDIVETQTLSPTASGELSPDATATEISITDQNQQDKLAYILDGLTNGFMDMDLRRAETIECKYTLKQKEITVDGKKVNVYMNFNVNVDGINNSVVFDDKIGDPSYGHDDKRNELFKQAFTAKKNGQPSELYIADPIAMRRGDCVIDIEMIPEKKKETNLEVQVLMNEIQEVQALFGGAVNMDEWQKIYLKTSGRPTEVFNSADQMKLKQIETAQNATATPADGQVPGKVVGAQPKGKPPMLLAK